MSVRITLLSNLYHLKKKQPKKASFSVQEIQEFMTYYNARFSAELYGLAKSKLAVKKRSPSGRNAYMINANGIKHLEKKSNEVWTIKQLREHLQSIENTRKSAPAMQEKALGKHAIAAIDSLSDIIDMNENLVRTLRRLQVEITTLLDNYDACAITGKEPEKNELRAKI